MKEIRICNRDGCDRHVYARNKCVSHFNSMIKSLRRQGSDLFAAVDTWTEIQKDLPGTLWQITKSSGISYNAVMKCINRQHAAGMVHISSALPPQQHGGARWVNIFALGAGVDHVVTLEQKKAHARLIRRQRHAAKRKVEKADKARNTTGWMVAALSGVQS